MQKLFRFFLATILCMGIAACSRTAPLVLPSFSANTHSSEEMRRAVLTALRGRNWLLVSDEPGRVVARQLVRSHSATIAVNYTAAHVSIELLESSNLEYGTENGEPVIHKNFLGWMKNLERDILLNTSYGSIS